MCALLTLCIECSRSLIVVVVLVARSSPLLTLRATRTSVRKTSDWHSALPRTCMRSSCTPVAAVVVAAATAESQIQFESSANGETEMRCSSCSGRAVTFSSSCLFAPHAASAKQNFFFPFLSKHRIRSSELHQIIPFPRHLLLLNLTRNDTGFRSITSPYITIVCAPVFGLEYVWTLLTEDPGAKIHALVPFRDPPHGNL